MLRVKNGKGALCGGRRCEGRNCKIKYGDYKRLTSLGNVLAANKVTRTGMELGGSEIGSFEGKKGCA
jgi:hypothetical protein